jgi:hypothetical protein
MAWCRCSSTALTPVQMTRTLGKPPPLLTRIPYLRCKMLCQRRPLVGVPTRHQQHRVRHHFLARREEERRTQNNPFPELSKMVRRLRCLGNTGSQLTCSEQILRWASLDSGSILTHLLSERESRDNLSSLHRSPLVTTRTRPFIIRSSHEICLEICYSCYLCASLEEKAWG